MPLNLDRPARDVDITHAAYAGMLENLQANILVAHGRDHARHVFVHFTGTPEAVRAWIRDTAASVTTAKEQLAQIERRRAVGTEYSGGVVIGFFLSAEGYRFLGLDIDGFASDAFRHGMKHQDPGFVAGIVQRVLDTGNKDPDPATWEQPYRSEIHALVTLADDRLDDLTTATADVVARLAGVGDVLTTEEGNVLRRTSATGSPETVEHFGYFDGISNPLFTIQELEREREKDSDNAQTEWDPGARMSLVLTDDPHSSDHDAYGSYLVYRKLGQDFGAFEQRVAALSASIGTSPDLAGAMAVGRFRDGTPVVTADHDGSGPHNDFNFDDDRSGSRCPVHGHIRKVNPRGTTPLTSLAAERRRRVVRRGIPYGPPMPGIAENVTAVDDPEASRGLLFMCFQRNIEDQFEFIQRTWADNEHFPSGIPTLGLLQKDTGDDPVMGQEPDEAQRWPKAWGDDGRKAFNFESAVTLKGGEYFFAPSLPFLRAL